MSKPGSFLLILFIGGLIVFAATQILSGDVEPDGAFSIFKLDSLLDAPVTSETSGGIGTLPTVGGSSSSGSSVSPAVQPPSGWTADELSPYYGKVKISGIKAVKAFPGESGFTLSAQYSNNVSLVVTGWRVKSNKGDVLIPNAIADYIPFGIPSETLIVLEAGSRVVVSSNASPISQNLRMNACIGYLNERYKFPSSLPSSCPKPYSDRSEISEFPGDCQSFILSMPSCHAPTGTELNRFTGYPYAACRALLEKYNYASCYQAERGKASFFSNEWRVWMNSYIPFDAAHDRILLVDEKGLLVDQYLY